MITDFTLQNKPALTKANLFAALKLFASNDGTRMALNGYLHEIKDRKEQYIATNGKLLIIISRPSDEEKRSEHYLFPETKCEFRFPNFNNVVKDVRVGPHRKTIFVSDWAPLARTRYYYTNIYPVCPKGAEVTNAILNFPEGMFRFNAAIAGVVYKAFRLLGGKNHPLRANAQASKDLRTISITASFPNGWYAEVVFIGNSECARSEVLLEPESIAALADCWDDYLANQRRIRSEAKELYNIPL